MVENVSICVLKKDALEVDILQSVDPYFVDEIFGGDYELYLEDRGYNLAEISYIVSEDLNIVYK